MSIGAIIISLASIVVPIRQSGIANEAASATIYDRATIAILELDKMHVNYPEMWPYVYENRPLGSDALLNARVSAVAEMTLDTFQIVLTQLVQNRTRFAPDAIEQDTRWMIESFKNSKVLRDYFDARKSWYNADLAALRTQAGP